MLFCRDLTNWMVDNIAPYVLWTKNYCSTASHPYFNLEIWITLLLSLIVIIFIKYAHNGRPIIAVGD